MKNHAMNLVRRIHPTLLSMWLVMACYGIVMQVIILIVTKRWLYYSLGAWVGVLLAMVCSGMLLHAIEGALDRGEKGAAGYAIRSYMLRLSLIAAVFAVLAVTGAGSVVTAFVGVFSIKISAYLQGTIQKLPFIGKLFVNGRK